MPLARRAAAVPASWMLLPMPETGIEHATVPGRSGAIPIKRFLPRKPRASAVPIFFIHGGGWIAGGVDRSEEHTSELQSLMRISYAVFCLKKKKQDTQNT